MSDFLPSEVAQQHIYESYREMADFALPVAKHFGLPFSSEALNRQRLVSGCVGLIDHMWDTNPTSHDVFLSYCSDLENGVTTAAPNIVHPVLARDLVVLVKEIEPRQTKAFFALGRAAVASAAEYGQASKPSAYVRLRSEEARSAAAMMTCVLPPAETTHPAFPRYEAALGEVSAARNAIDSIKDLPSDYAEGRTLIAPTAANYAKLTALAAREVMRSCNVLGASSSAGLFAVSISHSFARSSRKKQLFS